MKIRFVLLIALFSFFNTYGNDTLQVNQELTDEELEIAIQYFLDSIESTLNYETGTILLKDQIATINVPDGFKYLNGKDSEMILTDIWGNPPSDDPDKSLGMLIPSKYSPLADSTYSINITFAEEGYIEDDDAKDIDYDELLETMQEDGRTANEQRIAMGYAGVELVGWASPPFYDQENKKLHWAKELKFGGDDINTLNYNIRILGRKGYLQLNAIGGMDVLTDVKDNINPILQSVNFNSGHHYADFNPSMDKVAAYGIGGLIAGKVLLKAGIFAKIGLLLAKFWKIIVLGIAGLFAGVRKFRK